MTQRPVTAAQIKRAARQAELASATGATGYTLLRHTHGPIERLVRAKAIGPEELQAAHEIDVAFMAIAGSLLLKSADLERVDRGTGGPEPAWLVDAQRRYRVWAGAWSVATKQHGDRTLEVVIAAVVDERSLEAIELDVGLRHGTAKRMIANGLRDYAIRAGWLRGKTAVKFDDGEEKCSI